MDGKDEESDNKMNKMKVWGNKQKDKLSFIDHDIEKNEDKRPKIWSTKRLFGKYELFRGNKEVDAN